MFVVCARALDRAHKRLSPWIFLLAGLPCLSPAIAQNVSYKFGAGVGNSTGEDIARGIAVDTSGNVYTTGNFQNTVDFDPGAGTANFVSAGDNDIFIQKLNSNGVYVWATTMGTVTFSDIGHAIAVDGSGNVYSTGKFRSTVDFDPGAGTVNLTSNGNDDAYVQKLDTNGNLLWAKNVGAGSTDVGLGIAVDASGNVYVTGTFQSTVDFDPGAGTANLTASITDVFVLKLDVNGDFVWAKGLNGTVGSDIVVDATGNVYTTGVFTGAGDFDPGAGTATLTSNGSGDLFISKLDSAGDFVWAKSIGSTGNDKSEAIRVDGSDNVYIIPTIIGTADVDPGAGTVNITPPGVIVLKLDTNGDYVWSIEMPGVSTVTPKGLDLDPAGNVYTTGLYTFTTDFDPGAGTANKTAVGLNDIFISKLDSSGNFVWVESMGGSSAEQANAIAVSAIGDVHTAGQYQGTADFDPGAGTVNLISTGLNDIFVSKLGGPPSVVSIARADTNPTNAASVNFTVTFSESVTGVDTGDFSLDVAGITGASITGISGSGSSYTVTVSTGTGDGTLSIDLSDDDSIQNGDPTALGGAGVGSGDFIAGEAYTIDNTDPGISIGAPSTASTNSGPVTYTITYTGASAVTLAPGDVTLNTTGGASGTIGVTGGGTASRTVTISPISGDGTIGISIAAGTASDGAGNLTPAAGPSGTFTVDNMAPGISIGAPSTASTSTGPVTYTITYTGASAVTLAPVNVTLNTTGTAIGTIGVTGGGTASRTVTISPISGDGTIGISIAAGTATDGASNSAPAAGPSSTFTVDNSPPGISIGAPSTAATSSGPVSFTVSYTGANSVTLAPGDVTLNTTGSAMGTVGLTGAGTASRTVTISPISGNGTIGISIAAGTASDTIGNLTAAAGPSGTFAVDSTPPGINIGAPSAASTSSGPVSFTISYTDATTVSLVPGDVTLNTTGGASGMIGVTGAGTASRTVTISTITGDGTIGISILGGTAADSVGNLATAAGPSGTFTVDNMPPGISIGAPSAATTSAGPVTFAISYTGADTVSLVPGNVSLNTTGSASGTINVFGSGTAARTVTISPVTGDGTIGISIAGGTAGDATGNSAPAAGPSGTFAVDNTGPSVTVNNLTTNDSTPPLGGTIDDATATITVTVGGQTNPATNNGATWSLADNTLSTMVPGTYNVQVTATDTFGNVGMDATTNELTIQSVGPGNGGNITSNLTPPEMVINARLQLTAPLGGTNYQWEFDGIPIAENAPRVTGAMTDTLTIDPLQLTDSGLYSVTYLDAFSNPVETNFFVVAILAVLPLSPSASTWMLLLSTLILAGLSSKFLLRRRYRA